MGDSDENFYLNSMRRCAQVALAITLLSLNNNSFASENTRLDNLFLGVWSPFVSKWETSVPVCVWSESSNALFKVTATGLQSGTRFYLSNDIGDRLRYNVFWHFGRKLNRQEKLQSGVPSRGSFPFDRSRLCTSGPNAKLRVILNKKQISAAIPAIYADTVLIIFSPL